MEAKLDDMKQKKELIIKEKRDKDQVNFVEERKEFVHEAKKFNKHVKKLSIKGRQEVP